MSLDSYPIVGSVIPKANGISSANEMASRENPTERARKCSRSVRRYTTKLCVAIETAKAVESADAREVKSTPMPTEDITA